MNIADIRSMVLTTCNAHRHRMFFAVLSLGMSMGSLYLLISLQYERQSNIIQSLEAIGTESKGMIAVALVFFAIANIVVSSLIMSYAMLLSVLERTKDIAVMLSLGLRKIDIAVLICTESMWIGLLGGIAGIIVGIATNWLVYITLLSKGGQWDDAFSVVLGTPLLPALLIPILTLCISIICSIYPIYRATRLNPLDALRRL